MNKLLSSILNVRALRRMAGAQSFGRGEAYAAGGQVSALAAHEETITATVRGTLEYRVKLWVENGGIEYSCSCPVGRDGEFCKHAVAVGLAWLDQQTPRKETQAKVKPAVTLDDVRAQLASLAPDALVKLLMQQAMEDQRLRQRLLMTAAMRSRKGPDFATYRTAIDDAVQAGGFVEYREAHEYAQGIEDVLDSVEALLKEGHAAEVIDLAEHGLAAVEDAMGSVDDSDGHMGSILQRLQELHLAACKKARPDPAELARRLFAWELGTDWDTFYGASETYAGVLGRQGLAVYRRLAEAQWADVPSLAPGGRDPERSGKRFRITHIMETLARQTGDIAAIVAIKQRDLSSAYAYLQIAETYRAARQHDLALEWAQKGLSAFPKRTDARLREFLATEYHRRRRHDDAIALAWTGFTEAPRLDAYQNLKNHAERGGAWPARREQALAFLRAALAKARSAARQNKSRWDWAPRTDHSELVRIFLWEKDTEAAWQEAQQGGCSDGLWRNLAAGREQQYPQDALPVFQAQVEAALGGKNNDAYREAIGLLRKVRELMLRLGRDAEFARYLESVRAAHKPKRNFRKMLEHASWE